MRNIKGKKHIQGVIEITRKAAGYLPFPDHEDIEIRTEDLAGALNGDTVEIELTALFPRPKGKVKKVLSRVKEEFVGTIKNGTVIPDDIKFYKPIQIKPGDYADGEKVLVRLDSFDGASARGVVR